MSSLRVRLSEVATINPRRPNVERDDDAPTSFVPMDAVDDTSGAITRVDVKPYRKLKKGYTHFQDGDVIFAKITPCMQNGKHAVVRGLSDGIGFGSTEFHVIRPFAQVRPDWIHFFLRREETLNAAIKTFTGTVGQQRVPPSFLEHLELPLPPIEFQDRVAELLKAQLVEVDAARQAAQAQSKNIAMLRRRLLAEVFAAINDAPRKRLGEHAPTTSGSTPPRGMKAYWTPAEVPWVKTGEVAFAPISRTAESVSRQALAEWSLTLLPPGTVLVAMYGQGKTRGQSAILEMAATTNQACFAILPNETWEPSFLFHWLMASYHDLRELSEGRGGNQANLNGALLNALEVPAPNRTKQAAIARRAQAGLRDIEVLAAANQAQRDELERLPQRLLGLAFGEA